MYLPSTFNGETLYVCDPYVYRDRRPAPLWAESPSRHLPSMRCTPRWRSAGAGLRGRGEAPRGATPCQPPRAPLRRVAVWSRLHLWAMVAMPSEARHMTSSRYYLTVPRVVLLLAERQAGLRRELYPLTQTRH